MSIKMAKNIQEERYRWIKPICATFDVAHRGNWILDTEALLPYAKISVPKSLVIKRTSKHAYSYKT